MPRLTDFLAEFFPDEDEEVYLRAFKAKGAPDAPDNRPLVEVVTRRRLAADVELQGKMAAANKSRGWYFVVNAGGNTDADITRFNAVFVEIDDVPLGEQHKRFDAAPIQPSIRVETKKSVHAYWLIEGSCSEAEWRDMQARLIAYFSGDKTIKNPSRVMRLPFFNHVHCNGETGEYEYKRIELHTFEAKKRFKIAEMQNAFPLAQETDAERVASESSLSLRFYSHEERHAELVRRIAARGKRNSKGNIDARALCHNGKGGSGLALFPSGAVKCNDGCEYNRILEAEGLPPGHLPSVTRPATKETSDQAKARAWAAPKDLPDDLLPVPALPSELLPVALRDWITDIAERMQCPLEFPAVAALISCAALIGNRLRIRPKRQDTWTVVPNLWGAIVGRPGVLKTPALEEALQPLRARERLARDAYAEELSEYEFEKEFADAKRAALRGEMRKKGADKVALRQEFIEADRAAPVERRYITNDPTTEKLGELLNQNPRGLLLFRDELTGWLRSLEREGREQDRTFFLETWNGNNSYTSDRIGRGTTHAHSLTVSILGGIQPSRLQPYIRDAINGTGGDDGLIQRFQLIVYPDIGHTWRNVDRPPDATVCARVQAIFAALDTLDNENRIGAQMHTADNGVEYGYLRFDDEAQEFFNGWREDLEISLRSGSFEHPALEDHLSKYRKLMPALALIFHLLDRLSGESQSIAVTCDAARRAAAWCTFLEAHARRIYGLAINADVTRAKSLLQHLQKGDLPDEFSARDVYMKHWAGLATSREVAEPLTILEDHGWLRSFAFTGEETGGRPTARYLVHPSLRSEQAAHREAA